MIHQALQDFVVTAHGPSAWSAVAAAAGVDDEAFITMQTYPDELTYSLIGSASDCLQVAADQLLRGFGQHWIGYAASHGFDGLLATEGTSIASFLSGLDAMHARINLSFPDSDPPTFETEHVGPRELHLHYRSPRPGLLPFVIGLLEGLSARFEQPITIETVATREDGNDHDILLLEWSHP